MRKTTIETYEQGTGILLSTKEINFEVSKEQEKQDKLDRLLKYAEDKGWV